MQLINYPFLPFYTITIDFIIRLLVTLNSYNIIISITNKATKATKFILGKIDSNTFY